MAQKESNPEMNNDIGIVDDIGQAAVEATKVQYEKEIELFKDNLRRLDKARDRMVTQWAVDKELMELQLTDNNNDKLNPVFRFETLDRYKELIRKKLEWKYEQEVHLEESKTVKYEKDRKDLVEQLESTEKALANLLGEDNE